MNLRKKDKPVVVKDTTNEPHNRQIVVLDGDGEVRERLKEVIDDHPLDQIQGLIQTELSNRKQMTSFTYYFPCFKEEGAYAVNQAIKDVQLFSTHKEQGMSEDMPETIDVTLCDGSHVKVPWGTIQLPNMGDEARICMSYHDGDLYIEGQCERQHASTMDQIVDRAKWYVKYESIYSQQAITLDGDLIPKFIDLKGIEDQPMFLSEAAQFAIEPIRARIERSQDCRDRNLSLKFGALLEGEYGTGKTLLAFKLAAKAIRNGWTFIYLTDPHKTSEALKIAGRLSSNGNGTLFFVEDIDLVTHGRRNDEMNRIFNVLDGGDTKTQNIITVFTTNHIERIDRTLLRGKRIGAIITLGALDKSTAKEFIYNSVGEIEGDIEPVLELVEEVGIVPAFFAEILDRVKSYMIFREKDVATADDIINSINSYRTQMDMAKVQSQAPSNAEALYHSLGSLVADYT